MFLFANIPKWIKEAPDQYMSQEMCEKAVRSESRSLEFLPDHLKVQGMCNNAVQTIHGCCYLHQITSRRKKCDQVR